jgi:C4-dicarboxylate transporter DctQ subunit
MRRRQFASRSEHSSSRIAKTTGAQARVPDMLKLLDKAIDAVEDVSMIILMAVATVLTFAQVIWRYVFNDPVYWIEEVVLYSIITMSFVAASMGVRCGGHITVDLLKSMLPASMLRLFTIVSSLLGILFAVMLAYYGSRLFLTTLGRWQLSPALRIPVAWVYLPIAIAGVTLIYRYFLVMREAWKGAGSSERSEETKFS